VYPVPGVHHTVTKKSCRIVFVRFRASNDIVVTRLGRAAFTPDVHGLELVQGRGTTQDVGL
jgi:hypothetical protein